VHPPLLGYVRMKIERMREPLDERPDEDYWEERSSAGWRLAAIEWKRETAGEGEPRDYREEVPFGLRVGEDCHKLVEDPAEMKVLTTMMDMIVDDQPMSKVAEALNERGFQTRAGKPWTMPRVFQMLPRLIEVGPRIFSTEEWRRRRGRLLRAV
jgi:recombinase